MKRFHNAIMFFLIITFCLLIFTSQSKTIQLKTNIENIKKITESIGQELTEGDLEGVLSLYADDAILMPPNQPAIEGKEAFRLWQTAAFERSNSEMSIISEEIIVSGDWAFSRGVLTWASISKITGKKREGIGKYILTFQRQTDGSWKAKHDIWNSTPSKDKKF